MVRTPIEASFCLVSLFCLLLVRLKRLSLLFISPFFLFVSFSFFALSASFPTSSSLPSLPFLLVPRVASGACFKDYISPWLIHPSFFSFLLSASALVNFLSVSRSPQVFLVPHFAVRPLSSGGQASVHLRSLSLVSHAQERHLCLLHLYVPFQVCFLACASTNKSDPSCVKEYPCLVFSLTPLFLFSPFFLSFSLSINSCRSCRSSLPSCSFTKAT